MSDNPFLLSNAQKEQTPSKNPFALSNIEAEQNDQLRTRLYNGAKADPAKAARADILAKESGLPSDVVMRNLQDVEFRRAVEQADATLKTSPKLAQALREQMFLAEQAHKDVPSLSQLEQQLAKRADRTVVGTFGDIGVTALKGAVGLPQAFVGLADIVTGGYAGAGLEAVGLRFGDAQKFLDQMYSPAQQRANEAVREAQGFLDTLGAMLANPSTIATTVGESAPQMLGGAAIGRGILAMAPKVAPWLAAAFGEGVMGAGATAEQVRSENADGLLSAKQVFASVMSGAGTALFGAAGGRAAQKLGLGDIDTVLVSRGVDEVSAKTLQRGFVARLASAGVSEGFFEEMPQSVQEQMWNNFATDKPLGEGVGKAAAQGLLVGLSMGTGFQAVSEAGTALQRRQLEREAAVTRALNDSQQLTEAMQSAAQVTLRENNPTTFQQLIDTMAKGADGEPQSVFIDAQVLMQLATPEQINELLPSVAGQLREAATTNSSVEVPMAEALTRLPGTPLEQVFLQNAKSSPDALSQLEAEEAGKKAQEFLQQEEKRILKQVEDAQVWQASSDKVKQTILDQLNATGRFTPSVNDAYATLQQQFFSVMAQRLGTTPEDLYKRYALKVRAQGQPGAQVLNAGMTLRTVQVGDVVDGRVVRDGVPNLDAIGASLDNYEVLPGVREVPISAFDPEYVGGISMGRLDERTRALAQDIQASNEITPLIVVQDADGMYVLEGGHRFDALIASGAQSLPAVVVIDQDSPPRQQFNQPFNGPETATTPLPEGTTEIEVDGVMRPALNSEGRPIHWSEEGVRNFWRWFGDSKVIDAEGRPLVVYHGTTGDITQFDASRRGENTGAESAGMGFFFTDDIKTAESYANFAATSARVAALVREAEAAERRGDWDAYDAKVQEYEALDASFNDPQNRLAGQNVLPVYIRASNPLQVDAEGENAVGFDIPSAIRKAVRGKYDGLVIDNLDDAAGLVDRSATHYVAFDPTQIKSATGNSGAFDPANPNILMQSAYHGTPHRGITKFSTDKIGTGEGAQAYGWGLYFASRREIAEWYRRTLTDGANSTQPYYYIGGLNNPTEMLAWRTFLENFQDSDYTDARDIDSSTLAGWADILDEDGQPAAAEFLRSMDPAKIGKEDVGQLYEVDIPEDSEMLLWDKPLSEQPEGVRAALAPFLSKREQALRDMFKAFPAAEAEAEIKRLITEGLGQSIYEQIGYDLGTGDRGASEYLLSLGIKGIKYLDGTSRGAGDGSYNYVVFSGDDVAITNQFYQGNQQGPRGTFKPKDLLITLNETADLSTFLHESGHFFLDAMADMASQANAPAEVKADMAALLKWFGVPDLATWNSYTFYQKSPHHEKFAQGFEAYLFEGKTSNPELQSVFRRFSEWLKRVYQSLTKFVGDNNIKLSEDVRMVMDRMLATEEQIRQAEEAAGLLPNFDATNEAIEQQTARSLRDMAYIARARGNIVKELQKHAADLRAAVEAEVRKEVEQQPLYAVMRWLRRGEMTQPDGTEIKAEKGFRLSTAALAEMYPESMLGRPALENLKGMTAKDGLHPDLVADMFGFQSGDQLVRAILDAEPIASVVEGMTDQRMLERYGELATQEAIEAAANDAIHNKARARILATEMKAQAEMLNGRTDTGRTASNGRAITVNSLMKAAKDFASALAGRRRIEDLKKATHLHRTAEARAGKAWQEATGKGDTQAAVQAKRDQVLNNAAVRALLDAQAEAKKIVEFFRKVTKGNNEKIVKGGRDPDVVNAMRAVLAAYGVAPRLEKSAQEYMEVVSKNDPAMYNALKPGVDAAVFNAKPLNMLTMDELRALNDELQAMWALAKRSRQSEIDGNLIDRQELEEGLVSRMQDIGVPDALGATGAPTKAELARQKLQHVGSLLRRVEQWAEGMDGAWGGPFLRYVFQPIKEAANRYRAARVDYRKRYQALVDKVAPFLTKGTIIAPELGNYEFGRGHRSIGHAELLHAILHTGNESNKRKLLLGRGWATENPDGSLDTSRWDSFIARMQAEGVLRKEHYDFAQGVWDLLEDTKPLAQKTHREVYGRYFDEVTANQVVTPFGTYRGGYVPAQVDTRIVSDNEIRKLAEAENENMAYSFPTANRGFTKSRTEYNRPLLLDLRTIGQHIDKVLLFSHMQSPINDVTRLLSSKEVSATLSRIDPTIYAGMLTPWLSRSVRQIVETPLIGDGGISRVLTAARSRAGMSLMFANVSNAIQQTTGFLTAMSKLKSDGLQSHMMRATAQFIANPKKTAQAVADASEFMAGRMENEIAALNDAMDAILLDPSLYEKAQAWTQKHAYFLQTALANTMEPIIWNAAYNAALEKGMSDTDAVRYADGLIRQTQGSTLPEDVSRIETGPAYARVFTQFIGYFNMMANTLATGLKQIAEEMGLKKGAGKALGIVTLGMLAPLWAAEAITLAMKGGPEDEDDDGYLDDWLAAVLGMGTIKGMFAMVPFVGQLANAGINRLNNNPADDRVSLSPAVSLLESAVGVPSHVYKAMTGDADKINARNAVRDVASAVSIATGLPAVAVARPLGYLAGMADDRIEPTGPVDFLRGMISGTASPESKQR